MKKALSDWYGWRARLGIIYTSSSTIMEHEFYAMAPRGVSSHTTRVFLGKVTAEELIKTGQRAVDATRLLATAPLHSIIFGCTSGSFLQGLDYDTDLIAELSTVSNGIPVTTTSAAMVKGLGKLDLHKLIIISPYTNDINERAKTYFEAAGFSILGMRGLDITTDLEMTSLSPEAIYRLARSAWQPEADGLLISCTSLRTIEILEELEADLGKPVISSNQASFWSAMRMAGVNESVAGFGKLLEI